MRVSDLRCFISTGPSKLLHRKRFPLELALVLCEFDFEIFRHHRSSPMRGGLKCARIGSDQLNRSARPRRDSHESNVFFFLFSALASTTKSPLTPSRPPAQYTYGQISPSQPPSLRSFPFVFVFLFLVMTFRPVDMACLPRLPWLNSRPFRC
ncbi:hypothetical protein F5888DRAFT_555101 [Russula emetica]|nr:hypothetical protein F5888DRAFT_555101 [Russula emetica]